MASIYHLASVGLKTPDFGVGAIQSHKGQAGSDISVSRLLSSFSILKVPETRSGWRDPRRPLAKRPPSRPSARDKRPWPPPQPRARFASVREAEDARVSPWPAAGRRPSGCARGGTTAGVCPGRPRWGGAGVPGGGGGGGLEPPSAPLSAGLGLSLPKAGPAVPCVREADRLPRRGDRGGARSSPRGNRPTPLQDAPRGNSSCRSR